MMINFIDTHAHLDGEEFAQDLPEVVKRAREQGAEKIFVPAIDVASSERALALASEYPGVVFPMVGLHPEEVKSDYQEVIARLKAMYCDDFIAIGEVGLDFYWSREFEQAQLDAFRIQVEWAVEKKKPLMIHCRKAQNEMVKLLREYEKDLVGGVFHCFTGNEQEAEQLLSFPRFVLGIGGVLTFKKSPLPTVLPQAVPLHRIVLETDAPYMAPVPKRGTRNESSFIPYIISVLAQSYGVTEEEVAQVTTQTANRLFLSSDSQIYAE